ncbi:selenium metabolism-associated LysR family transcriptional regulator [Bacillus sp. B15-48]|uniref:selenium metabolism-associated LysR family transcriptional regulator n=1 Tax=Bacillus sp. B15-48 TaxID=1548601 RepID=UPI00193F9DA2|nr:selenium metabolism-associated LysR family transcriptional regulator [Bacillus sp. B15-48]MBM4764673.1 LysR family transcriptional regulator [Bacillus sp. B15-48]
MDLHQLFVFTKVVENKSFSKAAEEVFLSQSTVSAHINALEKALNGKLFDRVGRESVLTPYGERLFYWAQQLLLLRDEAMVDLNKSMTELRGMIRIGASSVPGQYMVPQMIDKFRADYPHVTFQISESSSKKVAEKVQNGLVDFGIIGNKYENEKLHYIPLLKDHLVLITAGTLEMCNPISIHDLLKYPFIMRNADSGTNALLERLLRKNKIAKDRLNVIAYTDSSQSLMQFVKQGIGIAIISEIVATDHYNSDAINTYEIEGFDDERYFYLVYNHQKTLSLVAKLFIKLAEEKQL